MYFFNDIIFAVIKYKFNDSNSQTSDRIDNCDLHHLKMLNIVIKDGLSGQQHKMKLCNPFARDDFIRAILETFDLNEFEGQMFSVDGKYLKLDKEEDFNREKHLIKDGSIIYRIQRTTDAVNVSIGTLLDTILSQLPTELKKLPETKADCPICMESGSCITICHDQMCVQCYSNYFKGENLKIKCTVCSIKTPPSQLFSPQFMELLQSYHDLKELLKNIDCQMCHCGFLCYNDLLRAKSNCPNCHRCFCFFCNQDWNDSMNNTFQFTCKNQCTYEKAVTFSLTPFKYGAKDENDQYLLQIPNQRCCPQCLTLHAYDGMCKYHTCDTCNEPFTFCFFCLKSKADCMKDNHPGLREGEASSLKCTEPQIQDYSIFPRFLS